MRKTESFSAYHIKDEMDFGFSPEEYSRFKYGSKSLATKFGTILADKFIKAYSSVLKSKQMIVLPSAYSHIKTASGTMVTYFIDEVNFFLYENNCAPVEQTKISRTVTYREDYGEMSANERFNLIKGDKFHIDKTFLEDKVLIFIDDIKVTGTHERIIIQMLDEFKITNECYMLYLAEIVNPTINPNIENYLNNKAVKTLNDLEQIIKNDLFVFNTRVIKFILNSPHQDCINFLSHQTTEFVYELFSLAIGNDYGKFEGYRQNLSLIQSIVKENSCKKTMVFTGNTFHSPYNTILS